ncbi:MAG TPA: prepilin-type N-terminal cleavage/methylation domain-containing protein [Tepidisphaeraceae bacterium]|jgi:general secretion pathway protein G
MRTYRSRKSGFTLVEILIVVIILGILAAIVIPQFTNASTDARKNSTTSQLQTVRSQIELYKLQHNDTMPPLLTGGWTNLIVKSNADGTTTGTPTFGPYLQAAPVNPLNQQSAVASAPATAKGWVFDSTTGKIWATGTDPTKYYNEATGLDQATAP